MPLKSISLTPHGPLPALTQGLENLFKAWETFSLEELTLDDV